MTLTFWLVFGLSPNLGLGEGASERLIQQEAQLSQRDCVTLRVVEYFAKSLKVIRNDTVE